MILICSIVILFPNGYRDSFDIEGRDLDKDAYSKVDGRWVDSYLVDFTTDLKKRGFDKFLTQTVFRVNNNDCLQKRK